MPTPPVLLDPEFAQLWQHVSAALDRRGITDRGWVRLPDGLPATVRARLGELVPGRSTRRLDLAALERRLGGHGSDLLTLLAEAGCPPTGRREALDLDRGGAHRRPVGLALAYRAGAGHGDVGHWDDPEVWAAAGLPGDLVATPVLTWALPLLGEGLAAAVRATTAAGAPMPLTLLSLRAMPIDLPSATVVRSVENPRLLEAAVQQGRAEPMICTSGNPTTAPSLLIRRLLEAGVEVRHHGDLDPDGVAITARLYAGGVVPWRMTAADYTEALADAERAGVELREITGPVPPTPWDPELQRAMERAARAVDEERVMDALLAEHGSSG